MPAVSRGDSVDTVTTNHDCVVTTTTSGMSGTVKVEGTGVHRKGDSTVAHGIGAPTCPNHSPSIKTGSTTVFANGMGVARVGDGYTDATDIVQTGSISVFAGG